jgi:hypothetical protein
LDQVVDLVLQLCDARPLIDDFGILAPALRRTEARFEFSDHLRIGQVLADPPEMISSTVSRGTMIEFERAAPFHQEAQA